MYFSTNYEKLMSAISEVQPVAEDTHSDAKVRNIIFELEQTENGNKCTVIGVNGFITFKRPLDVSDSTIKLEDNEKVNGKYYFQLNSKEIVNYLSSYRGLSRTEASDVIFETVNNRIRVTVIEVEKGKAEKFGAEEGKTYSNYWMFNPVSMSNRILQYVQQTKGDEELTELNIGDILLYTNVALQLLLNDPQQKQYSSLFFSEKVVYIQSAAFSTVLANAFAESGIFDGIAIFYGVVSFLNKVFSITESETFSCYKGAGFIYLEWDDKCAFIKYDTVIPPFKHVVEGYKLEHYVKVDRLQIKDIIRRLLLADSDTIISIDTENNCVRFDNEIYNQTLTYSDIVEMAEYTDKKFRIKPAILGKAIIGKEENFSDEESTINLVYCSQNSGSLIFCISDDTGAWFSYIKVRAN